MRPQRTCRVVALVLATTVSSWFVASSAPAASARTAQAGKPAPAKPAAAQPAAAKPAPAKPGAEAPAPDPSLGPQLVIDTAKGTIVIQLFEKEAPKSIAQIVRLTKQGFYRNQKVHRVVDGQLIQFGDKQTRDATLREWWGRGPNSGSGRPIGVGEVSKTRKHKNGTMGMAHTGNPMSADSQMYITMRPMPNLDGKYTIIGEVVSGLAIVPKIQIGDRITEVTVKSGAGT